MTYTAYLFPVTFAPFVALAAKKQVKQNDEEDQLQDSDEDEEETKEGEEGEGEEEPDTFDFTDPADGSEPFKDEDEWQKQGEKQGDDDLEQML